MGAGSPTFTAVAIPWSQAWQVVILDPEGTVVTTAEAARLADAERVGRAAGHSGWS